jgi:hypothetical protein
MTLIIGMNFGAYVLLAADTRVCFYPNGSLNYRDDREKIRRTSMGLITACGFAPFIDAVNARLDQEQVYWNSRVPEVVKEERPFMDAMPWGSDPRVRQGLDATCWMFTYMATTNPASPHPENSELRLAYSCSEDDYDPFLFGSDKGIINNPLGMRDEDIDRLRGTLDDRFKPASELPDFRESLLYHLQLIRDIVTEAADCCETVSSTFQVGVQNSMMLSGISPIILPGEPFELSLALPPNGSRPAQS